MLVVSQVDVIKYMLSRPILRGRVSNWKLELLKYSIKYNPMCTVKGQALADFLANHLCIHTDLEHSEAPVDRIMVKQICASLWTLSFDGSRTHQSVRVRIVIGSPEGNKYHFWYNLDLECTRSNAEYEALIIGLEILLEMRPMC